MKTNSSQFLSDEDLKELKRKIVNMVPGPYEYLDRKGNDLIVSACRGENALIAIAGLAGIKSRPEDFSAIAALLNAAPQLIAEIESKRHGRGGKRG